MKNATKVPTENASPLRDPPALPGRQQKFDSSRRYVARKFTMLRGVECDSPVNPLRCAQLGSAKLPKPAARVRIGSCRNEFHEIQNHPSEMVLRGRDSVPAAALSGSLFLKPPALPEDIYCRPQGDTPSGGCRLLLDMFQDIPHTADGVNQGLAIVVVNFTAQAINVNVYHIGCRIKTHMPYMVEDHRPSNYTARVPAKVLQQSELLRGKLEDTVTPLRFAPINQAGDRQLPSRNGSFCNVEDLRSKFRNLAKSSASANGLVR